MLQTLHIDVLLNREWIQVDVLIRTTCSLKLASLRNDEHVSDVLLLLFGIELLHRKSIDVSLCFFESVLHHTNVILSRNVPHIQVFCITSLKHFTFFVHEMH